MEYLDNIGKRAKKAAAELALIGKSEKNNALNTAAKALITNKDFILTENDKDIALAKEKGVKESLIDRLRLTNDRIKAMADGLSDIAALDDPVGEVISMKERPNGLIIGQKRVPLGVIGIIYESRPNVTADAFGLCFKTSNAVILRGGSDAINSNKAICSVLCDALKSVNVTPDAVILIEDTSRETATELMRLNKYVDVLIPRGGAGLISTVVNNSTIPVIETGTGNCHIFVDETADLQMAADIIENAKTQRTGVCNALESLVVHEKATHMLPAIAKRLYAKGVEIRGCEKTCKVLPDALPATDEDWGTEYLDLILSCKVVSDIDEAIEHINCYNTGHSEAIITNSYENSQRFLNEIDAAAVYVNASTRFTDGFEFGFGAEIGISTQKLHARGPMGLKALTTTKNIIYGNGQIRK
ncbi:MAG: glutamate-5-semialdehyde dehydrogenase [Eubacteriales bacterium]|nr:glutamate-5-semialdehyde dehydrogenase [Eubacteriales bacterium]